MPRRHINVNQNDIPQDDAAQRAAQIAAVADLLEQDDVSKQGILRVVQHIYDILATHPFDKLNFLYAVAELRHFTEQFNTRALNEYERLKRKLYATANSDLFIQQIQVVDENGGEVTELKFLELNEGNQEAFNDLPALTPAEKNTLVNLFKLTQDEQKPSGFLNFYLRSQHPPRFRLSDDLIKKIYHMASDLQKHTSYATPEQKAELIGDDTNDVNYKKFAPVGVYILGLASHCNNILIELFNLSDNAFNFEIENKPFFPLLFMELLRNNPALKTELNEGSLTEYNSIETFAKKVVPELRNADLQAAKKLAWLHPLKKYMKEVKFEADLITPLREANFTSKKYCKLRLTILNIFEKHRYQSSLCRLLDIYKVLRLSGIRNLPPEFQAFVNAAEGEIPRTIQLLTVDTPKLKQYIDENTQDQVYDPVLTERNTTHLNNLLKEHELLKLLFRILRNFCKYIIKHPIATFSHDQQVTIRQLIAKTNEMLLDRDKHPIDRLLDFYIFAKSKDVGKGELHEVVNSIGRRLFGRLMPVYANNPELFKDAPEYHALQAKPAVPYKVTNDQIISVRDKQVYLAVKEHVSNMTEQEAVYKKLWNFIKNIFYSTFQIHVLSHAREKVGLFKRVYPIYKIGAGLDELEEEENNVDVEPLASPPKDLKSSEDEAVAFDSDFQDAGIDDEIVDPDFEAMEPASDPEVDPGLEATASASDPETANRCQNAPVVSELRRTNSGSSIEEERAYRPR